MRLKCVDRNLLVRLARRDSHSFSKYYEGGVVHTASINDVTKEKTTLQLSKVSKTLVKATNHPTTNNLPEEAIDGLLGALLKSDKCTPRQIQSEADQKFKQLRERKMPAPPEEVREARAENLFRNYKWRPLTFKTREQCAAYALATLPMHYAEAKFAFDELDRFDFKPESVLDYGSGAGGAFWAAHKKWGTTLKDYSMVDPNTAINHFAMDVMRSPKTGDLIAPYASFRKSIVGASSQTYDLVVAQRVLSEIDSEEARMDLFRLLWERTDKYLVFIEANLEDHFKAVMQIRDYLITMGIQFDKKEQKTYMSTNKLLDDDAKNLLIDKQASQLEKYNFLKHANIRVPTEIERGYVVAPCPHDTGCPMYGGRDKYEEVCTHIVKYKEIRADGRNKSYEKSGLLRSIFTYLILAKGNRPVGRPLSRILRKTHANNCEHCRLCTPFEGLQRFSLGKRAGPSYEKLKLTNEGCLFPLEEKIVKSDSELHFIREMIEEAKKSS